MRKAQVEFGKVYEAKISGRLVRVRLIDESPFGGWVALNLDTGRRVRIKSAAKLRREIEERD